MRIALQTSRILADSGIGAEVVNCSGVKPADEDFLKEQTRGKKIYTLEEHMITGGFGEYVTEICRRLGICIPELCFGITDRFIPHGSHELLMKEAGLSAEQIAGRIVESIRGAVL